MTTRTHDTSMGVKVAEAQKKREQVIQGIRELADFLEQNPDVPTPTWGGAARSFYGQDSGEHFRAAVDAVKPTLIKDGRDEYDSVTAKRLFTGGVDYMLLVARKHLIPDTHMAPPLPDWLTQYQTDEADQ